MVRMRWFSSRSQNRSTPQWFKYSRTLSNPAMFLLSAKNCAGDFDCKALSPLPPGAVSFALGGIFASRYRHSINSEDKRTIVQPKPYMRAGIAVRVVFLWLPRVLLGRSSLKWQ
eukprot:697795-Pyramimonas_sp.AAC.2